MFTWKYLQLDFIGKKYFYFLLIFRKKKILNNYQKGIHDLVKKMEVVKSTTSYCKKKKWHDIYKIWNVAGFILMTSLDIKIINEKMITSRGFGRNEFIIKTACILIYEVLEDLEQILGKDFYQCLHSLSISKNLIDELNKKKKEISLMKSEHQKDLNKVRNIIGAHRDHDFLSQIEVFNSLENTSTMKLLNEFEMKLNALSDPLQLIINESAHNFSHTSIK